MRKTTKLNLISLAGLGLLMFLATGTTTQEDIEERDRANLANRMANVTPNASTPAQNQTPGAGGITMAKYDRIKTGMSYKEVVEILGKEGKELSNNEVGGIKTVVYQWEAEGAGSNMNATFQKDKLLSKAQFGLR